MPTETPKTKGRTCGELCKPVAPFAGQKWRHADGREAVLADILDGDWTLLCGYVSVPPPLIDINQANDAWPDWSPVGDEATLPLGTVLEQPDVKALVFLHAYSPNADTISSTGKRGTGYVPCRDGRVRVSGLPPEWVVRFNPDEE